MSWVTSGAAGCAGRKGGQGADALERAAPVRLGGLAARSAPEITGATVALTAAAHAGELRPGEPLVAAAGPVAERIRRGVGMSPLKQVDSTTRSIPARDGASILVRRWVAPGANVHTFVILIPDVHEDTSAWEAWGADMADQSVDVEGFDLRGRGGSSGALRWADLLEDLESRVSSTRGRAGHQPVAIHAHGVAAMLALDYAATDHTPVDLLSLLAPLVAVPAGLGRVGPVGRGGASIRSRFQIGAGGEDLDRELPAAATRFFAQPGRVRVPVRLGLVMGHPTDPLPFHGLRGKLDITTSSYPERFGHDLHTGEGRSDRAQELRVWLHQQAQRLAPETTVVPRRLVGDGLTRMEARARFKEFVATERDRLERFEHAVAEQGGPDLRCDRGALNALGAWMIDALVEGEPSGEEPMWASHWRQWPGPESRLSTDTMWLIDGLAAHIARCYGTLFPDREWELDTQKQSVSYHQPVLGLMTPPDQAREAVRAARSDPAERDWLGKRWDYWADLAVQRPSWSSERDLQGLPVDDVSVTEIDGPFDVSIWIPETAEMFLTDETFATLDKRIAGLPGITDLVWEDREVMLARLAPGVATQTIRDAIVALLAAEAERAAQANDDE